MNEAVDYLLTVPSTPPSPPLNNYDTNNPDPDVPIGQKWVNYPNNRYQITDTSHMMTTFKNYTYIRI